MNRAEEKMMKNIDTANAGPQRSKAAARKSVTPKVISVSSRSLIKARTLQPGSLLPLVVEPAVQGLNLPAWAQNNRELIEGQVRKHGAILFRGFDIDSAERFAEFTQAASGDLLEYRERSSPRHEVSGNVYTSTDYPPEQSIFPHNEHSYCQTLPLKLFFCCVVPATEGGETPIADCRRILTRIPPKIRERFIEKRWMYVRNFGHGFGLPWETVFQTSDKLAVEAYCRRNDIQFRWKENNQLTTRQVRPPVARHPRTGEMVWFNHATFFHVSTLEPTMRDTLLDTFAEEDLPNNTYYGDGSPIEPSTLDALRESYQQELISFTWQQGDVVLLDNMLTAHSRRPFAGARKVLFAMTDSYTRTDF